MPFYRPLFIKQSRLFEIIICTVLRLSLHTDYRPEYKNGDEEMSGFDERGEAFEKQFAHDQALQFKVEARRNKLLGLWVAGLLGHKGQAAEDYAVTVIRSDMEEPGDEDVFRKVRGDLDAASVVRSDEDIRSQMVALMEEAKKQIREQS